MSKSKKLLTNLDNILKAPCKFDDVDADNIGQYLYNLLFDLWIYGEGFDSKRPFGNSGWDRDLFIALVEVKAIEGTVEYDEDGYIQDCQYEESEAIDMINNLINHIFAKYFPKE